MAERIATWARDGIRRDERVRIGKDSGVGTLWITSLTMESGRLLIRAPARYGSLAEDMDAVLVARLRGSGEELRYLARQTLILDRPDDAAPDSRAATRPTSVLFAVDVTDIGRTLLSGTWDCYIGTVKAGALAFSRLKMREAHYQAGLSFQLGLTSVELGRTEYCGIFFSCVASGIRSATVKHLRWPGDQLLLQGVLERDGDAAAVSGKGSLVLRQRGRKGVVAIGEARVDGETWRAEVTLPRVQEDGFLDIYLRMPNMSRDVRLSSPWDAERYFFTAVTPAPQGLGTLRPYHTLSGHLSLVASLVPFHAEARLITVADGRLHVSFTLHGHPGRRIRPSRLLLARRVAEDEIAVPVVETQAAFEAEWRPDDGGGAPWFGLWDFWVEAEDGTRARLVTFMDDLPDKKDRHIFPALLTSVAGMMASVEPYYTARDQVSVNVRPMAARARLASASLSPLGRLSARVEITTNRVYADLVRPGARPVLTLVCLDGTTITVPVVATPVPKGSFRLDLKISGQLPAADRKRFVTGIGTGELFVDLDPRRAFRIQVTAGAGGLATGLGSLAPGLLRSIERVAAKHGERIYGVLNRVLPASKDVVLFQSFHGKSYADSPRRLYEAMLESQPRKRAVWVLDDVNKPVPGHAVKVKPRSLGYYYYMARAGYFVNNANFPDFYVKRPGVKHVQTWHGTPLKRIGLHVDPSSPGYEVNAGAAVRERYARWDYLLAPNAYCSEILREAFDFKGEMIECGYPRNDLLADAAKRDAMRAALRETFGVQPSQRSVLYAPTWRDDKRGANTLPLSLPRARDMLANGHRLFLRAHHEMSRALLDVAAVAPFARNVSAYDDANELLAMADILVTDYSSVMFDFALTGRPMIFFAYDLQQYTSNLRGFYFDFLKEAPGPIVTTQDELFRAIRTADEWFPSFHERYARFQERFTAWEKGDASQRVLRQIFA